MRNSLILPFISLIILAHFSGKCESNEEVHQNVFPGTRWQEKSPESLGVNPVILDSALSYFRANSGGVGTDEMVVIRNGYIIWKGPGSAKKHQLLSVTKIFTSTVMGILITDGLIKADDPAVKYYPELAEGNGGQDVYRQIRLFDLATMTAGYHGDTPGDCWQLHLKERYNEAYACTQRFTIPGKPDFPPKTMWKYSDHDVHMLGYILTKVCGKSLQHVFKERVADEIGMKNWTWSDYGDRNGMFFNNPAGTPNDVNATEINKVQGGIWTTPEELARLGLLYLNDGKWNGKKVLNSSFVKDALSNLVPATLPPFINFDLAGRYGYYWWTNGIRKNGTRPWPSAPPETATPQGGSRNFCFVIPEWDMVIARMSPVQTSAIPAHGDPTWEGFFKILKPGVKRLRKLK